MTKNDQYGLQYFFKYKLNEAIAQAESNYISIATGALVLKTMLDEAKAMRNNGTASAAAMNEKADELLSALNTYFKAQMISENDKSSLIINATFDTGGDANGWTNKTSPPTIAEGVGEFFREDAMLSQEITLDNAYYLVYVQAFYRDVVGSTFFANDKSTLIPDMYSQTTDVVENQSMGGAAMAFLANVDNYANYLLLEVTNGKLTIGIEKPDAGHWLCFDNFKLYKIVNGGVLTTIDQISNNKEMDENLPVYNMTGVKVGVKKDLPSLNSEIYIMITQCFA